MLMLLFLPPPVLPSSLPISSRPPPILGPRRAPRTFIRLVRTAQNTTLLQTSITTYKSPTLTLHLHSILHFASLPYYKSLQKSLDTLSQSRTGAVLYELIAPSYLSIPVNGVGLRKLNNVDMRASVDARRHASRFGLVAQMDAMEIGGERWYIADLSKEETLGNATDKKQWGWGWSWLAWLLPMPELFALTWGRGSGGSLQHVWRVVGLIGSGRIVEARKVLFARRMVKWGERRVNDGGEEIGRRREGRIFEGVRRVLDGGGSEVAVVYGVWHAGRICRWAEDEMGLVWEGTQWRDVMEVEEGGALTGGVVGGIVGILWGIVAGGDWGAVVESLGKGGAEVWEGLGVYFLRHGIIYWGIRRWFGGDEGE